eukprot:633913-Ditylum_brightwellii.AAC.1
MARRAVFTGDDEVNIYNTDGPLIDENEIDEEKEKGVTFASKNAVKHEAMNEAHSVYLQYHRHFTETDGVQKKPEFPMFHRVAKTGVIYATSRARAFGFHYDHPEWANMGQ